MSEITHIAVDAARVTITSDADLRAIATSAGRFLVDGVVREVTTQPAGFFDVLVASESMEQAAPLVAAEGLTPTEEYQLAGGTLRLARAVHADPVSGTQRTDTTAVWEAQGSSLALTTSDLDTEGVLGVLERLELVPSPEGLAVLPGAGVSW